MSARTPEALRLLDSGEIDEAVLLSSLTFLRPRITLATEELQSSGKTGVMANPSDPVVVNRPRTVAFLLEKQRLERQLYDHSAT